MALGAIAGGLAVASYLNAKYHLSRDSQTLFKLIRNRKLYEKAVKEKKVSPWYWLEACVRAYPQQVAIWSRDDGIYTYAQVHDRTVQYAQWFLRQNVKPRDLVALYLHNSPDFLMIWFALLSIGAAPAFINHNLEGKSLMHCLDVCKASLFIVDSDSQCLNRINASRDQIEVTTRIYTLDQELKQEIERMPVVVPGDEYRDGMKGSDLYCLIYTSGTTGLPKGAQFVLSRIHIIGSHIEPPFEGVPGVDRVYNSMPLYHGTGAVTAASALSSGLGVAIGKKFSASGFFPDVCDSDSTIFVYVGETVRYLLNMPPHPLERKHRLRVAYGNGLRPDVWQKFQDRFNVPEVHEFFNSSEGMFMMLVRAKGPYLRASVGHHGLIFRLMLKNRYIPVMIDHETGDIWRDPKTGFAKRMPYEEGGEIIVVVDQTDPNPEFTGYWNSEGATKKKFVTNVFKKGDKYYRTGDALKRSSDGHWHFMDRLGDTYRWKSENVSTAEVAETLGTYPGIAEANVYGVEVPHHEGRAGCAAIHVDPNAKDQIDYNSLLKYTRSRLPRYAVPVFLRIVKDATHIHNNKQNKVPLRKEGVNPDMTGKEDPTGKDDTFLWVPPKRDEYVAFTKDDWQRLQTGSAHL